MIKNLGVVAIGRNEGPRLRGCLESVRQIAQAVVYVDSGSTDDSVAIARELGVEVVLLDPTQRFSAARARNAGFQKLRQSVPTLEWVQFVDGDCEVVAGWFEVAVGQLVQRPELAVVCGRRRERYPEASVYNAICDLEWDTPVGEALASGGDALMRVSAFTGVSGGGLENGDGGGGGGFNHDLIAGEEPELCDRLRQKGWKILRLPEEMTRHDVAMTHFKQWWRRQVRSGYGGLDVEQRLHAHYFSREIWRARMWGIVWPMLVLVTGLGAGMMLGWGPGMLASSVVFLLWPVQMLRIARIGRRRGLALKVALAYGLLGMLGNWAQLVGQVNCLRDRWRGRRSAIIEYRATPAPQTSQTH